MALHQGALRKRRWQGSSRFRCLLKLLRLRALASRALVSRASLSLPLTLGAFVGRSSLWRRSLQSFGVENLGVHGVASR